MYDERFAIRLRSALKRTKGIEEKKMFGGICFFLHGNMLAGVWKEFLFLRLGVEKSLEALREPHVRVMDVTGKPMAGWVMVELDAIATPAALLGWIHQAIDFVSQLPKK